MQIQTNHLLRETEEEENAETREVRSLMNLEMEKLRENDHVNVNN
jgi:hypothetical protein